MSVVMLVNVAIFVNMTMLMLALVRMIVRRGVNVFMADTGARMIPTQQIMPAGTK